MSDVKEKTGAVLRETAVLTGAVAIIAAASSAVKSCRPVWAIS